MTPSSICPSCGNALTKNRGGNICPACLLRAALLAEPVAESLATAPREALGTMIGRYKLLEEIGEGGFGIVYMAEQTEPVKRRVALKVLKPGMDTREVVARFEAERQALALMDHPNIARVHDGGTTDSGRPYFVMELVKGMPLTTYCDNAQLTTRERLDLFLDVLSAVQHAHQKGIIHRDLKPSNILVSPHDGQPVIKVIDFGIAKALSMELTSRTLFTGFGQMLGTPQYTSPEQAEMNALDVDTRSDIYSLGVVLYELLTGQTPLDARKLRESGYAEIQRIIREDEPPKPSTRIGTLGQSLPDIARHRGAEPLKLAKQLRGDLDWIVMKALEKDRKRRYETANGFAADLRRHLADEPVVACPPSAAYRFQKLVRRNRAFAVSIASIALTVICALALSLLLYSRERSANHEQTRLRTVAEEATEDTRRRLVRAATANAVEMMDSDQGPLALPWLVEALRLEQGHPSEERIQRMRIADLMASHPSLVHSWHLPANAYPAVISPDGSRVAAPCDDGILRLWNAGSGDLVAELRHNGPVRKVVLSPDGKLIATASDDKTARLWNTDTGTAASEPVPHDGPVLAVAFSSDGKRLITGGKDNLARIWDVDEPKHPVILSGHSDWINDVAFSKDGLIAATISKDKSFRLWNTREGSERSRFSAYGAATYGVKFSPDGNSIVTLGWGVAHVLDLNGQLLYSMRSHMGGGLRACAFSPDESRIATAGEDQTVQLAWANRGGTGCIPPTFPHPQIVRDVAFNPVTSANAFATACDDGAARVLSISHPPSPPLLMRHAAGVISVAFDRTGKQLLTTGMDRTVRLWKMPGPRRVTLSAHGWPREVIDLRDSNTLIAFSSTNVLQFNAATGEKRLLHSFTKPEGILGAVLDPERQRIAIRLEPARVVILSSQTGEILHSIPTEGIPLALRYCQSSSEWLIASAPKAVWRDSAMLTDEKCLVILSRWDAETFEPRGNRIEITGDQPRLQMALSPDGKRFILLKSENRVCVFDTESGESLNEGVKFDAEIRRLIPAPDSATMAVISGPSDPQNGSGLVSIVSLSDGAATSFEYRNSATPVSCTFSPDSKRLAIGYWDGTVMVLDSATAHSSVAPMKHQWSVESVDFSQDGRLLLTCSKDCTARIWDSETGEPVSRKLPHEGWVGFSKFCGNDGGIITWTGQGVTNPSRLVDEWTLWNVPFEAGPIQEVEAISGVLSCSKLGADSTLIRIPPDENTKTWAALPKSANPATTQTVFSMSNQNRPDLMVPERSKDATPAQIDLSAYYNGCFKKGWQPSNGWSRKEERNLTRLEPGIANLGGISFDVRGVIQLLSTKLTDTAEFPEKVTGIKIGAKTQKLHFLHACAWDDYKGTTMGRYVIHYVDDAIVEIPLVSGINIRDWTKNPRFTKEPGLPEAREVWQDTNPHVERDRGSYVRLFVLSWNNPKPDTEIRSIDLVSSMTQAAPFLMAITRE